MKANDNTQHSTVTHNVYRKLRHERQWGVLVRGSEPHPGDRVEVVTKAGRRSQETVAQVIWSNGAEWLCRVTQSTATGELGDATDEPVSTAGKYPHLMKIERAVKAIMEDGFRAAHEERMEALLGPATDDEIP